MLYSFPIIINKAQNEFKTSKQYSNNPKTISPSSKQLLSKKNIKRNSLCPKEIQIYTLVISNHLLEIS